jgi:PAS domain S-box-containing protein
MDNVLEAVGDWKGELRHTAHDGRALTVESQQSVERDAQGRVRAILEINRDITKRKVVEEELRRTSAYLENLLEYANAPIIVWDPDLRITRFNQAFERLTQRPADEVVGRTLDMLFPDASREASLSQIGLAVQGASLESDEIAILRADGSVRTVLWSSANIYDTASGGTLLAVIAQGQDITERKLAEEELRESEANLVRKVEELNRSN